MASIKDVAKLAGVSMMTASRAINKSDMVSPETRAIVMRAVNRLGYRPNLTARSLRSKRTNLLGLLLPDIENPVFSTLAKYVEVEAERYGYHVMLGNTGEDPEREINYLDIMYSRQMDGVIILPISSENRKIISSFPTPKVVLDRTFSGPDSPPSVKVDNVEVGRLAGRHLLDLGHTHFACITGPLHVEVFAQRLQGLKEVLSTAGFEPEAVFDVKITGAVGYGEEVGKTIFASLSQRPLALFCANDMIAFGAMRAAGRLGLSVPEDVSVVGVDDIPAGELATPSLTTVRQPIRDMASEGVNMLLGMLSGAKECPEDVVLSPELVTRESTAKRLGRGKRRPRTQGVA